MARLRGDRFNFVKPWKAEISYNGQRRFLGYFATKDEAIQAERAMRLKLTGNPERVYNCHKFNRHTLRIQGEG